MPQDIGCTHEWCHVEPPDDQTAGRHCSQSHTHEKDAGSDLCVNGKGTLLMVINVARRRRRITPNNTHTSVTCWVCGWHHGLKATRSRNVSCTCIHSHTHNVLLHLWLIIVRQPQAIWAVTHCPEQQLHSVIKQQGQCRAGACSKLIAARVQTWQLTEATLLHHMASQGE